MPQFHATVVEVFGAYGDDSEPLTVHFDDEANRYLQLQEIPDRHRDPRSARVYVEVDGQGRGGGDCFSSAELARARFRIVLTGKRSLNWVGEWIVTFDVDEALYQDVRNGLRLIFSDVDEFRCLDDMSPKEKGKP